MPKVPTEILNPRTDTIYPHPFDEMVKGRIKTALGTPAGLTQFGVHLTELLPNAASALRHRHENEEEFIYVLLDEIGTRADSETVHYPDVDLIYKRTAKNYGFFRKDGRPYEEIKS